MKIIDRKIIKNDYDLLVLTHSMTDLMINIDYITFRNLNNNLINS